MLRHSFILTASLLAIAGSIVSAADPKVLDPRFELRLVASEPAIVTPIGMTFDHHGRLMVVECHTHFPPQGYQGPSGDRIRIAEDLDGDGDIDEFKTFYEGTRSTMSLRQGPDGWLYVATRMEVFRIRDNDRDDVAETREDLVRLETKGDYPHNGLGGLAFDHQGRLLFGLGENLGEPYAVIGRDGAQRQGGGEGGNIYRCLADGTGLEQIATGFWNPFGICVDSHDRIFAVENDPDASPPCRLLHIVPSADYGYQFRYGRPGRHPLQAWNGELPGTLPMLAGTGEAPCTVLPYDGQLWVTSWGNYRIERFQLRPRGASFVATSETVVQGDENFRPVDMVVAPDGSLYFTDWVDRSYEVHSKGRIWRLSASDAASAARRELPPLTPAEQTAQRSRQQWDAAVFDEADPFQRQAGVHALIANNKVGDLKWADLDTAGKKLGALEAARWQSLHGAAPRKDWLREALHDADPNVRILALRWVAEASLRDLRVDVEQQLQSRVMSPQLLQVVLATLEWLDTGKVAPLGEHPSYEHYLITVLRSHDHQSALLPLALRLIGPDHGELTPELFRTFIASDNEYLRRQAIRTLVLRRNPDKFPMLAQLAADEKRSLAERADAVVGLADKTDEFAELLNKLAAREDVLGRETKRILNSGNTDDAARPSVDDLEGWLERLGTGGDPEAGWRVFFGASSARCAACHRFEGRGSDVGPDLTLAGQQLSPPRLLDSVLNPDREVAPRFVPWNIETADGRVLVGMSIGVTKDGRGERYLAPDGTTFELAEHELATRQAASTSIMPRGIEQTLTDDQLRDLFAFLRSGSEK